MGEELTRSGGGRAGHEAEKWDGESERDLLGRKCQTCAMWGTGSDSKAAETSVSECCMTVRDRLRRRLTDLGKATKNVATDAYW